MTDPIGSGKTWKSKVASDPPRVFISYSHDSREHEERVLALADRLRADGIDARIDQYVQDPEEGWIKWMRIQVREAEKALLVFTETYKRRFEGDEEQNKGLGATFEGVIVTQSLYESGGSNAKFRPAIFHEEDAQFIPIELRRFNRYNVGKQQGYQDLLRWLHRAPRIVAGPLGPRPDLPPNLGARLFQSEPCEAVPDLGRQLGHPLIEHLATFPFPKARDADCYDLLGVAWSEQVDRFRSEGKQPPYIPRAKDAELDAAFNRNFFVLISGPSKAGKTRTAFELLLRNAPESALVIPTRPQSIPTRPESIRELIQHLGAMQSRPAALTLWLDDLESFLLTRRFEVIDLSALSKLPGIKVVSTIRNEVLREIDSLRGAQEVIARAARISLEAEMTKAESAEAGKLYPDIRLSKGLGESFIAGPQLKQRFDVSTSSVKSVVTAARDWSRTGMLKPITEEDLATLFQIYFKKSELLSESDTEFHDALRHACKPIVKYSAMLVRCDLADGKKRFAVSDYLGEHIERQGQRIPEETWDLALQQCDFPEQYGILGWMANKRGLEHLSEQAYLAGRRAKDARSIFNLAVKRRGSGKIDEAVTLFREYLTGQPDYAEAHYNLAVLIEKTDPSGAEVHYRRSIELKPSLAAAHNDYGVFLDRADRKKEALEQYLAAIVADPLLRHPHVNLRNLIGEQPLPCEIRSIYEDLFREHPNSASIHAAYGYWFMQSGQTKQAEKLLRKAIQLQPDCQEGYSLLGSLLSVTSRFGEAEEFLKKALQYDPADGQAHYNLGVVYGQRGANDLAEREYRAAVRHALDRVDGWYVEAWYNLGTVLDKREAWEEAEKCYREAIQRKPNHARAHNNLGRALHWQGKIAEAEKEFHLVLEIEPNHYSAHFSLAGVLYDKGDLAGAKHELLISAKLAPDFLSARQALAALHSLDPILRHPSRRSPRRKGK